MTKKVHIFGILGCSAASFGLWAVTNGIAWSVITTRQETTLTRICAEVSTIVMAPFLWIAPRSILDGPQAFVLMSLFWGVILYSLYFLVRRQHRRSHAQISAPDVRLVLLVAAFLGVAGCTPHSDPTPHGDPMAGWKGIGTFDNMEIPESIKQDALTFFQTLPAIERNEALHGDAITYWEDGKGQHAAVLDCPHDGERWHQALIYDRDNRRIKVIKYSDGGCSC